MGQPDYYRSLRILALREVMQDEPSSEYSIRRVLRWYSKTFHTPLHVVEAEIPLHDVLVSYYEMQYQDWKDDDDSRLKTELHELSLTDEEVSDEALKQALEEVAEYRFDRKTEEEESARVETAQERIDREKEKLATLKREEQRQVQQFIENNQPIGSITPGTKPGSETAIIQDSPPEIRMNFMDMAELDKLAESDGLDSIPPLVGLK